MKNDLKSRKKILTLHEFGSFIFGKLGLTSWSIVYLVFGLALIFVESYLFGHIILESSSVLGNDSSIHLVYIDWYDRFFPKIPMWLPFQGTGASLTQNYPIASYILTVFLHRETQLSTVALMKILYFISVPLTAYGVYFFAWLKSKNQTVGLLAGLLYPLSAAVWSWIFFGGFFAQQISLIFVMPTMFFFDLYLYQALANNPKQNRIRAIYFVLFVAAFAATLLIHNITGLILVGILFVYGFFVSQERAKNMRWLRFKRFLKAYVAGCLFAFALSAFFIYLFVRYTSIGNRDGLIYWDVHQIPYLKLDNFFGFHQFDESKTETAMQPLWDTAFFAIPVGILAACGTIWVLIRRNLAMIALAVISGLIIIFAIAPHDLPWLVRPFTKLWSAAYLRTLLGLMLFLPILAAYGARETFNTIIVSPYYLYRFVKKRRGKVAYEIKHWISAAGFGLAKALKNLVVFCLTLALVYFLLNHYLGVAHSEQWGNYTGYGPLIQNDFHLFKLVESQAKDTEVDKNPRRNWPKYTLNSENKIMNPQDYHTFINRLNLDQFSRVDFAPGFGGPIMRFNKYTDASQIEAYTYTLPPAHALWGFQQNVFYSDSAEKNAIDNLASWYGTKYVFPSDQMQKELKDSKNWQEVDMGDITVEGLKIPAIKYSKVPELVSVFEKPKILVIGRFDKGSFYHIFKLATFGMLNYEEATLIEGNQHGRIDDYTPRELRQFDALILYGYQYKNKKKAYNMLDQYVKEGGRALIISGWQYANSDWETKNAPDVFPVQSLEWSNFGTTYNFKIKDDQIAGDIDTDDFSSLDYFGSPWGVSVPPEDGLRDWAKPVLSVQNIPLVAAGEYGQGKVVWSGMNWPAHIIANRDENGEESKFLKNLLLWLLSDKTKESETAKLHYQQVSISRNYPDQVEFTLNYDLEKPSYLFWRESYYPDWRARLVDSSGQESDLKIYRGGPGMMLMNLPENLKSGSKIRLEYHRDNTGLYISIIALILLLIYFIEQMVFRGSGLNFISEKVVITPYKKISQKIAKKWEADRE